jgi:predicted glycosyltransferase
MLPAHPRSDIEYRLALYWHDGGGVGHFVRQARIADAVLAQAPGSTVFGISGSSGLADHLLPRNVDTVKLPSFVYPRTFHPRAVANTSMDLVTHMRRELLAAFMTGYEPDVLLVDSHPGGWGNELDACYRRTRPAKVLGLRGVLDGPAVAQRYFFSTAASDYIAEHFGTILVYTDPKVFRLEEYYDIPQSVLSRFVYTGYVTPYGSNTPQNQPRRGSRVLVAHFGSGRGSEALWKVLVPVLSALPHVFDKCYLFGGMYFADGFATEVGSAIRDAQHLEWRPFSGDMLKLLATADLFVGAGGYNSIAEILSTGTNSLLVNRQQHSQEQEIHITRLAELGLVHKCATGEFTERDLPRAIERALAEPRPVNGALVPLVSGAERAASCLLSQVRSL